MSNFLKNSISIIILFLLLPKFNPAQCVTTTINAQAGTGPSTTICSGQCASLTATISPPPNSTTTYSVASVSYSTLPYFGGNNVFSTSSDDLWSDSISIGFNFCYFGNTYNKLLVGSNGEITFDLSMANGPEQWITTAVLPNLIEHPGNTICGTYRDYDPFPGGVVRTYTTGVAPCRQFVAYWSGVTLFSCSTPVSSFQIVLYEGTNQIAVNIQNSTACPTWNNGRGLIGIQNAAASVAYGPATRNTLASWTAINESWRFVPTAAPSFSVNWAGPAGFTATGLTATPCPTASGNYSATISYCGGSKTSTVQVNVATPTINVSASSTTVCAPGSVTLTATGATTYTWLPGSTTGSSVVVSPTVNTTYTVLGTSGTCTGSATIPITVGTPPTVNAFNLSGTICPGGSANAVATGALSYTWNPGGITGNIVALSPLVSTIYTVTGSAGGCPGTATVLIPVGNTPTITASSSPTSVCAGSSATLSASGAASYTWNPGALTGSSVSVTPASTTVYTVTGTTTLVCPGTQTVMLTVNTTPTLTAVSNPAAICAGGSATLTSTGATTYTWMPGSLSGGTVTVSPASTTVYTVTGSNGTCSSTKTVQTTVNTVPTVTASISASTVCAGTSVTLTAGGATTYTWNPGNLSGSSVITTPTANTTYTVVGSNGTCTNSAMVSVTVNPSPTVTAVANPTAVCSGAGTTVTLTSSGAVSYTWMPGSLSGATVTATPASTTTYTVTGANAAGCTSTNTVLLTVNATPTVTASASSSTICAGATTTLTSSGATTYTWMPGSLSGASVSVSPGSTTTYTVTGANGSCSGTNTITITVNPNPTVTASSNPTSICSGSSATLTGNGATTYTWMPGSLTGSTVSVSPGITTTYTVTGNTGSCSNTATVTLTVTATPTLTAAANPIAICAGASATLTSTGATSYTWNPGSLSGGTVVVSPTVTTNYTVTGANGACTSTKTVNLIVIPSPTVSASASPTVICSGNSATLTGSGATTYTWMPGSLSGATVVVSPTITTTYTLTGATGACTNTTTVALVVNSTPTLTAVTNPTAICVGGSATLTSTGATSYTWNPGALSGGTVTVSPTVTTVYTVTGANATCSTTQTVSLTVNPTPTVTAAASSPSICSGSTATLTSSGATTYTWMPGSLSGATVAVSPTVTTTYTVTGATAAGCTNTNTVTLSVSPGPTLVATASPTSICSGSSSTLSASGATTYTWMPGSIFTGTTVVTPATTTIYTVTGNNGTCSSTMAVTVSVTPQPTVTAISNPTAICAGQTATLTGSGATTYTWMPGSLSGGSVTVSPTVTTVYTITGANGSCSNTNTVSLTVNSGPTVTATSNPTTGVICSGRTATLTAGGAVTYTWMPGNMVAPTVVVGPTVTTTYTLTGDNGLGCTGTTTITITVNPSPTITVTGAPSLSICSGQSATLTASGAVGTYTWLPGPILTNPIVVTPTISTTYTVAGSNGGCRTVFQFMVTVTPQPTVTASASASTLCAGSTVTLTGTGAPSFTWMPGSLTGGTVTATPTVTTTYTVTGAIGSCTSSNTVLVSVTLGPTVTASSSPTAICSGNSATLTAGGATTYTWMPGSLTGTNVTVNPTVTTTYTVTGDNGTCTNTATVTLTVTTTPTITAAVTPTGICSGATATLTSSGAATYTWMPGSLSGGTVTVSPTVTTVYTVTGANGSCTNTNTVSLTVSPLPTVTAVSNPTSMCAGNSATLTGNGATTYTWMPGSLTGSSVVVNPTVTTTYTLTGANGGCTSTTTVSITIFSGPSVLAATSKTAICLGDTATLSASGAISYTWNPGGLIGTPQVVTPTVTTIYTVTGSNGICSATSTVQITVNTYPAISTTLTPISICAGGTATIIAAGATTYTWMPGSLSGSSVTVSPTVTTTYTITGANGSCTSSITVPLTVNPNPTVTASSSPTTPACAGSSYTLTATGATSYTWMPGSLSGATVVVTPAATTVYTVTGANASGCSSTKTINVLVIPGPTLTAVSNPTSICSGQSATLTSSGALTYTWNPGALSGATVVVNPTVTTTYSVTGINLAGCAATKTVSLVVNTTPTITAGTSSATLCSGSSATLTSSGATTYTWNPGPLSGGTVVVTPTTNTTYTVVGANGTCTDTKTVSITVNPTPTVTASASPTILCIGGSSTLTANGATSYTWMPGSLSGGTVVVSPTVITTYTVSGVNAFGCTGTNTVMVNVNTPTITASATPTIICIGSSATITASGASTYTWMPGASTGTSIVVNPTVTTTYSVAGTNTFGCTGAQTVNLVVVPMPTVTAVASSTAVCAGNSATLTGSGATTYTWMPGSLTGTNVVVTPTATTVYTITGSNGTCSNSNTISLTVNPNPTVTGVASPSIMCSGATSTLSALGATSYTWYPGGIPTLMLAVTPSVTTVYTVSGTDALGCMGTGTVQVTINDPTVTATSTPTSLCIGSSATLTASGASTYTWNPGATSGSSITVTPTVTTTYSVTGTNTMGCQGKTTLLLTVFVNPTVTAAASPTTLCSGLSTTLTSGGAMSYTWIPGSMTGSMVVTSPTTTTTYSVIGVNGVCAADTATITINVLQSPQNVTATNSGTITCLTTSVNLFGSTTSTNVGYAWTGPGSYTSSVQNPTGITTGGVYTLSVIDLTNGCTTTATTAIMTNTAGPTVSLSTTGTINCITNTVSISVSSTVAAVTYTWSGPSSFTSTAATFTTSTGGVYTVSAFDPASGCTSTNTIATITDTYVAVTATIIPASCTGTVSNNDGTIIAGNFVAGDKYDLVAGATYTGSATYATASVVGGVITTTLTNPAVNTPYTIRFFGANGCIKDTTLILVPVDCSVNNALGLAKAITTVTINANGSYSVTYKVVVKNTGFATLNNVALTENLSNTFPLPTTFTVSSAPMIITPVTSLTLDPTFNGSTQSVITNTTSSSLIVGEVDTLVFTVDVTPNGVFGTFNNSLLGTAVGGVSSTVVADSSQVGLNTDPDNDGNPTNNNTPTPLNLTPKTFFGVTKQGELSQALIDGSYDITYTVSVHNLGNDTLRNIILKDSLAGTTIKSPASYSMKSGPTMLSGTLTPNTSYNGNSDPNLIVTAGSKMAPNTVNSVVFTINVMPDTCTVISNSAFGSAIGTSTTPVIDLSNDGTNPDVNGNGIWNEASDNVPTVLMIDKFLIPEVFTPNGDGVNDFFVIKGIQKTENTLTVYNRWGNKVYKMDNYDNTWNGMPNVSGTLGNQKLPQGTYYYILEFKGETNLKTTNGFVVLQY